MKEKLEQILREKAIKSVYHPIVSLTDGSVLGYEALSRITLKDCDFNIGEAFLLAEKYKILWDFEKLCKQQSLKHAVNKPPSAKLFLNVDPNAIYYPDFKKDLSKLTLEQYNLTSRDIVLEATERTSIEDVDTFKSSLSYYKEQGFSVAMDDVGSGYSGINRLFIVNPHFIKIDIEMIRDIHKSEYKKSLLRSIVKFANNVGSYVIAEGVENSQELEALIEIGVHYAQGFHWYAPNENFLELKKEQIDEIKDLKQKSLEKSSNKSFYHTVDLICKKNNSILYDEKLIHAFNLLHNDNDITELVIVDKDDNFLGILPRKSVIDYFKDESNFNWDKYVKDFIKTDCLTVAPTQYIHTVAEMAMSRNTDEVYDNVFVVDENKYVGFISVRDLFMAILNKNN